MNYKLILPSFLLCVTSISYKTDAYSAFSLILNGYSKELDELVDYKTISRHKRSIWTRLMDSVASAAETLHMKPLLAGDINDIESFGEVFENKFHDNPNLANAMLSKSANGEKVPMTENKPKKLNEEVGKGGRYRLKNYTPPKKDIEDIGFFTREERERRRARWLEINEDKVYLKKKLRQISKKYNTANEMEESLLDYIVENKRTLNYDDLMKLYIDGIYTRKSEKTLKEFMNLDPSFKTHVKDQITRIRTARRAVRFMDSRIAHRLNCFRGYDYQLVSHMKDIRKRNNSLLMYQTDKELLND